MRRSRQGDSNCLNKPYLEEFVKLLAGWQSGQLINQIIVFEPVTIPNMVGEELGIDVEMTAQESDRLRTNIFNDKYVTIPFS